MKKTLFTKKLTISFIVFFTLSAFSITSFCEPLTVVIINPNDGSAFSKDEEITFQGRGYSLELGVVTAENLVWTSDMQGNIGVGNEFKVKLGIGTHTITLTATDSEGTTGTAQITVTVVD